VELVGAVALPGAGHQVSGQNPFLQRDLVQFGSSALWARQNAPAQSPSSTAGCARQVMLKPNIAYAQEAQIDSNLGT
jgi:hypothetical protein